MNSYYNHLLENNPYYFSFISGDINNSYINYIKINDLDDNIKNYSQFVQILNNKEEFKEINENYDINDLYEIDEKFINNGTIDYIKIGKFLYSTLNNFNDNFMRAQLLDIFAFYHNFHWFFMSDYSFNSVSDLINAFNLD